MHELTLMESIAAIATEAALRRGARAVTVIRLRVGSLAGVDPDALQFAAEVVLEAGLLAGARLEVELVPALAWCQVCGAAFAVELGWCLCPQCGVSSGELRQGLELELAALELQLAAGEGFGANDDLDAS
jgi:hydrogenase nickel incorporation protein HypA/HybF